MKNFNFTALFPYRWKAQQHNLIGQIQTKDTLLDQCINLRRMYETKYADYKSKFPGLSAEDIQNSVCGTKAGSNGGVSPAEQLLRDANFTHMKKDDQKEYMGAMYPCFRSFCLKDQETWKQFHRVMLAYQEARIPHPKMNNAIDSLNKLFKDVKAAGSKMTKQVNKIIKENK